MKLKSGFGRFISNLIHQNRQNIKQRLLRLLLSLQLNSVTEKKWVGLEFHQSMIYVEMDLSTKGCLTGKRGDYKLILKFIHLNSVIKGVSG